MLRQSDSLSLELADADCRLWVLSGFLESQEWGLRGPRILWTPTFRMRTEKLSDEGQGRPACDTSEHPSPPGPYGANVEDSICCRDYIRYPLPLRLVKYYYWTSNSCRRPGVV